MLVIRFVVCLLFAGAAWASDPRDPTKPPALTAKSMTSAGVTALPVVSSIVAGADRRLAIIDGELRRVGDRVGAMTITRIATDGVELTSNSKGAVVLRLPKQSMHKDYR